MFYYTYIHVKYEYIINKKWSGFLSYMRDITLAACQEHCSRLPSFGRLRKSVGQLASWPTISLGQQWLGRLSPTQSASDFGRQKPPTTSIPAEQTPGQQRSMPSRGSMRMIPPCKRVLIIYVWAHMLSTLCTEGVQLTFIDFVDSICVHGIIHKTQNCT